MGDPAGIGPAIIRKSLARLKNLADFVIIGDRWVFERSNMHGPASRNFKFVDLNNINHKSFKPGEIKAEYGRASMEYLEKGLLLIKNNQIDCLVTCPVSKEAINLAGYNNFSGHTEYLAKRTGTKYFVMMLLNKKIKVSLVTRHIPLKDVPSSLTEDKIYRTISLTRRALKEIFLINNPGIAVCGLNPHASDNGILGNEENIIIKPALKRLKKIAKNIDGPLPADVAALKTAQGKYDCLIVMYHDQALIPLKVLGAYTGVNLTIGLPFIRTSPLHGTAFDIAANPDLANPASLIEAITLAARCALNQKKA